MILAQPEFLVLLLLAPLATYAVVKPSERLHRSGIPLASASELGDIELSLRSRARLPVLAALYFVCFVSLVLALARPQRVLDVRQTLETGRDIVLALDTSGSMQAMDFQLDGSRVDRLAALKHVTKQFVLGRTGDRIALVVFGNEAFSQTPLTKDQKIVNQFVDGLAVGMAGDGTAIGNALAISLKRVRAIESDSKVVVLVTDGKNNAGAVNPIEAAEIAARLGIKVHTIGIGSNEPAPFPVQTIFGGRHLIPRRMEFDEKTLQEIARITGGEYFNARDTSKLQDVYAAIDKLEAREDLELRSTEYEELFVPFALVSLLALALFLLASTTVFRLLI